MTIEATYTEILERLDRVETPEQLQSYAEWLYESGALDESEQTTVIGKRGPLAPWSLPASADVLHDSDGDMIARLASGEMVQWVNMEREWDAADVHDLSQIPIGRIEIYEDNAGGVWVVPVGQHLAITVPANGDALSDCRTYTTHWWPHDDIAMWGPQADRITDEARHIATYRADVDRLHVHDAPLIGHAGREYIGLRDDDLSVVATNSERYVLDR